MNVTQPMDRGREADRRGHEADPREYGAGPREYGAGPHAHQGEPDPGHGYPESGYPENGHPGHGYPGPVYVAPPPNRFGQFIVRMHERSPRWAAPVAVAACFFGAASFVWISNPTDAGASDIPTCIIKLTTGLDCPGCGGTRAFYYLMHGNVPEAARHHMLAVFAAPFLVWLYVAWTVKQVWGKTIPVPKITARTLSFYLAAWAVFMVVRNLPFAPFTSLYV